MKLHLHHFSKIKSQKESLNSRNQGFSYYFCMMIEGSGSGSRTGSGSGSIPLTSGFGSGSGRPKNTWIRWIRIRIRIRNTGSNCLLPGLSASFSWSQLSLTWSPSCLSPGLPFVYRLVSWHLSPGLPALFHLVCFPTVSHLLSPDLPSCLSPVYQLSLTWSLTKSPSCLSPEGPYSCLLHDPPLSLNLSQPVSQLFT